MLYPLDSNMLSESAKKKIKEAEEDIEQGFIIMYRSGLDRYKKLISIKKGGDYWHVSEFDFRKGIRKSMINNEKGIIREIYS